MRNEGSKESEEITRHEWQPVWTSATRNEEEASDEFPDMATHMTLKQPKLFERS